MPLPIAHGLVGACIVLALHPSPTAGRYRLPLFVGAFLANCADLDFLLAFALDSRAWHRGFTHSLLFALVVSLAALPLFGKSRVRALAAYGLAFASHGVLDFVTTKHGGGVELLWFASRERLKLGLVGLSEIPSRLTAVEVLTAAVIEVMIFAPLFGVVLWLRRRAEGNRVGVL